MGLLLNFYYGLLVFLVIVLLILCFYACRIYFEEVNELNMKKDQKRKKFLKNKAKSSSEPFASQLSNTTSSNEHPHIVFSKYGSGQEGNEIRRKRMVTWEKKEDDDDR